MDKDRLHFFDASFFTKLEKARGTSTDFELKAVFEKVQEWTDEVNIFEKDCIFVPINQR
jgi:sentrin-specific protease 7